MVFLNNLKGYKIELARKAKKYLLSINSKDREKIEEKLDDLVSGAQNLDVKKLELRDGYRLRYGKYRIIYIVQEHIVTVLVVDIDHRKDVYR